MRCSAKASSLYAHETGLPFTVPQLTDEQLLHAGVSGESERIERTESESSVEKFGEATCAFANDLADSGLPGHLFIGITDRGAISGVRNVHAVEQILGSLRSDGLILPPPVMSVRRLAAGGATVVVAEVQPSDRPPVRFKGRSFVRAGPRRGIATIEEERRLSERAVDRTRTWDMRPCPECTISDLSLDLFKLSYLPHAVSPETIAENNRSIEQQLAALRLFDLRRGMPTHAGVLLLGKDPLSFVPGAYVQFVRYDGVDQAAPVQEELRITGDLLTVLTQLDQTAHRIAGRRPVRQADLSEVEAFDYPPLALHEIFANAIIHRNYEGSTTPVFINEFSDRIEVLNPGSLYGDLSRSQFPGGVAYRNPVLAEAAKTLGFVNRFGRGIPIAKAELARNASPELFLDPRESFFLAVLRRRP